MKREIKFRAWNGVEMTDDVVVGKFGNFYVNPGENKTGLDPKDSASLSPFNTKYPEEVEIMQFTGMQDKNGKDIFEGDIVKEYGEGEPMKVFYNDNTACFDIEYPSGECDQLSYRKDHTAFQVEVIGNIYQNPDLFAVIDA